MSLRTQELSMAMFFMRRAAGHIEREAGTGDREKDLPIFVVPGRYNPDPAKPRFSAFPGILYFA